MTTVVQQSSQNESPQILGTVAEVTAICSRTDDKFGGVDESLSQLQRELSILQTNISSYIHSKSSRLKASDVVSVTSSLKQYSAFFKKSES